MSEDVCGNSEGMSDSNYECVNMKVKFMNGNEEHYTFPRRITEDDTRLMMNKIQEALEAKHLIIDLGSKVQIMPMNNILQIELTPPPTTLPTNCILGASLV